MALLRVSQLSKTFGGVCAVSNCSFEVDKGKITALIGPNGAGKTTVFNVVSGVYPSDEGQIFFKETEITHMETWRRARAGISRTFQLSRLFKNLSIQDNLLVALRNDDDKFWRQFLRGARIETSEREQIQTIMRTVGLEKDPETIVTDLSYGQTKLFDLCRALLNEHCLLMLDEPVAGVNPVLRTKLKTLLKTLKAQGETILLIEHDMDFVRSVADVVYVMEQGMILTHGAPERVLNDERVLEAYLGRTCL